MAPKTTQAYRTEITITEDGVLQVRGPFRIGESVEVIVLSRLHGPETLEPYPLRGLPHRLEDPFDPVAEDEWSATQ